MLIDWFTVAAQVINFLILVWLLKRFLYKPVLSAIDAREKRIADQLQEAEKKKADALKEQADFQHKNDEFEQHRVALLADATSAAKIEREKLIAAARHNAEALNSKLQRVNYEELDSLNKKVRSLAQKEVFSIARKTLADLAGVNLEERMTEVFIRRLGELDGKGREDLSECLRKTPAPTLVRTAFALPDQQKAAIQNALKPFSPDGMAINYETKPELIGGIELIASGRKVAWSIEDYLAALTTGLDTLLLAKEKPVPPPQAVAHAA